MSVSFETEKHQLAELRKIILSSDAMSLVLPSAVEKSFQEDPRLETIFQPVIERVIERAIEQDKKKMIEILFPIIGAAIKRSVAETFRAWAQSVETVIERSFTLEGLKWRIESFRTGLPIGEIALRKSLLYRVEHIFLIQKSTAKTLCHVSSPQSVETDTTLFGGMVEAISHFVRDVFITHQRQQLETLTFGQHTIWFIEEDAMLLAAIIWGNPSSDLKLEFESILSRIHFTKSDLLESETTSEQDFADCEPLLEKALEERKNIPEKSSQRKLIFPIATSLLLFLVSLFIFKSANRYYLNYRYDKLLNEIRGSENIYLVDFVKNKKLSLSLLASPSLDVAAKMSQLLAQQKLKSSDVDVHVIDLARYEDERRQQQIQNYEENLKTLESQNLTTNLKVDQVQVNLVLENIRKSYFAARLIGQSFVFVIEYPKESQKAQADSLTGYLRYMLERNGIYEPQLLRTQKNPKIQELTTHVFKSKIEL